MMKRLIYTAIFSISGLHAFAQDSLTIKEFDVYKDFKPLLMESMKIPSNPNPEIPDVKPPVVGYTLPTVKFEAPATIYTIKPLAMGTALLPKLKGNFVKLGYGNYNSPLFEAYLTTVRNKNMQAGLQVKHFSANPDGNRTFSDNTVKAWGKRYLSKSMIGADLAYNRNVIHYYGFQPQSLDLPKSSLRREFQAFDANVNFSNIVKDTSKIGYRFDLNYYNFFNNRDASENDFKLNGKFNKYLGGNMLDVAVGVNVTNLKDTSLDYGRVFVDLKPSYQLNLSQVAYLKVGFNAALSSDSVRTKLYFYPVAEAGYQLVPKSVTAYAGITGDLQRNTFRSVINENPFTSNYGLANTSNNFQFYIGFKGEVSPQTSFNIQFSQSAVENLGVYVFDSSTYSQKIIFDTTSSGITNIRAELTHEFSNKFRMGFTMNYFKYSLDLPAAYSRPTFTTRFNMMYNMGDKFIFRADVNTMNKRKSLELPSNKEITLKGIVDLNLGVDYRYNKNVSIFINLNNLTNNQYQRRYNYQVYGFNLLGGLTVTF